MGENIIHGAACRLEDSGAAAGLFGVLHVLYHYDREQYMVLGLYVVEGQELPPCLAQCPDVDMWSYVRADPRDSSAKQLVSALLTSKTVCDFTVLASREVL